MTRDTLPGLHATLWPLRVLGKPSTSLNRQHFIGGFTLPKSHSFFWSLVQAIAESFLWSLFHMWESRGSSRLMTTKNPQSTIKLGLKSRAFDIKFNIFSIKTVYLLRANLSYHFGQGKYNVLQIVEFFDWANLFLILLFSNSWVSEGIIFLYLRRKGKERRTQKSRDFISLVSQIGHWLFFSI